MLSRKNIQSELKKLCYFTLAQVLCGISIRMFLAGNHIAAGGFSGIAIVISEFFPVPLGVFTFILTLPFLAIAFFVKGQAYAIRTFVGSFIYSAVLEALFFLPTVTYDPLVAAVFGGLFNGASAVLVLKSETSSGGTDLMVRLLRVAFPTMSIGKLFLLVDGCVVIFSMIMYRDVEPGLYALITIYVCGLVNDRVLQGFDRATICYIITDNDPDPLYRAISARLDRSVTLQKGTGMYAGNERNILMTVLRPRQTFALKSIVAELDPSAFVVMAAASEVLGKGFKGVREETPTDALELRLKRPAKQSK